MASRTSVPGGNLKSKSSYVKPWLILSLPCDAVRLRRRTGVFQISLGSVNAQAEP